MTHSVVLDVYAEEVTGRIVHLEIQNKDNDEHLRRTRYQRSCIDTTLLDTGVRYGELPDILQIFITRQDFLKCGKAIVCNTKKFSDGVTELYFNLSVMDGKSEAVEKLQRYFLETKEENESKYFPELVRKVRFLKYEKKGVREMCEVFEQVRRDGVVCGLQIAIFTLLKRLGPIPQSLYSRIEEQEDESCLREWNLLAASATSIEEFTRLAK